MEASYQIDVFHGQLSPHAAQIYARVHGLLGGQEWNLVGRARGPTCRHAKTLPTNHSFVDSGMGDSLLARANIPDPCFWSPDLPALYHVTLELRRHNSVVQTEERELGLRYFGPRGKSFYLDGKRWVLRAVSCKGAPENSLAEWREACTAMLVHEPEDNLCCEASREGVLLVAVGETNDTALLRRLSRWASVAIVVNSAPNQLANEVGRQFPNVLLAQAHGHGEGAVSQLCSVLFMNETEIRSQKPDSMKPQYNLPIVAVRLLGEAPSLAKAREGCDLLQRDLAPFGDFAGYMIDCESAVFDGTARVG